MVIGILIKCDPPGLLEVEAFKFKINQIPTQAIPNETGLLFRRGMTLTD